MFYRKSAAEYLFGEGKQLIPRSDLVGHRLVAVLGDSSLSDATINSCDFIYTASSGYSFRSPSGYEGEDLLPEVAPGRHSLLNWPAEKAAHYQEVLWSARIADILVPKDPEERHPDTGVIALTSGWYVVQCGAAPIGIAPMVYLVPDIDKSEPMISVWAASDTG